ncbi:hypothetical protein AB0P15_33930 [Streptomyces sp. NPDC087917]|uniref:hypothetical protein n=1 Tax=Streptomyces sp. NPDC087917 TaxID=3155060 RepID=UPI0034372CE2
MSDDYDEMLTVLHDRAPHAKILSVGYSTVIPKDTSKCEYGNPDQFATITRRHAPYGGRSLQQSSGR